MLCPNANAPPQWSGELVRERLCEAFDIERRLPGKRRAVSAWLFDTVDTFADQVGRIDAEPVELRGVSSAELKRMDEALEWLRILRGYREEYQALTAWAACSGSIRLMLDRRSISRTTFYRLRNSGSERIARVLNGRAKVW
jgi:hypothetical protein